MTITRLTFDSLKKMQEAFFIDRFGSERGRKLFRLIVNAAHAYDYDGASSASLPYYIYAAAVCNRLGNITEVIPAKMNMILASPIWDASSLKDSNNINGLRMIASSFWERPDIRTVLIDYVDAAKAQADLTKRYFIEEVGESNIPAFRAARAMPHVLSAFTDKDPNRLVLSASRDQKIAQRFAGITKTTIRVNIPADNLLDSYLTNVGFVHDEYEIRYIRLTT